MRRVRNQIGGNFPYRKMSRKNKAWVKNGNVNYRHRVFAILGGSIIKSWDTDEYLKLSRKEIEKQLELRKTHFRTTPW